MRLLWAGAKGFRARRDAAGRAPGDCSAWAEAPGDCSERETGEFRLDELPQGEWREIVLRGGGRRAWGAGNCFERENGEFRLEELPQGQRREIVLRGGGGGGGILFWAGEGGVRAQRIAAGRAPGDCSA